MKKNLLTWVLEESGSWRFGEGLQQTWDAFQTENSEIFYPRVTKQRYLVNVAIDVTDSNLEPSNDG